MSQSARPAGAWSAPWNQTTPGRLAAVAVAAILGIPFLVFAASLDGFPVIFLDEPFFSEPALRYLTGRPFLYAVSARAPHGELVFAPHSPLMPRLQVLAFSLLGITQFAARISNFLAANLAVGVLAAFLLRRQFRAAALLVALAWVASPVLLEVMFARMEGLALLALACGSLELIRTVESRSARRAFASGIALGTACGFHPLCVTFAAAGGLLILGCTTVAGRPRFQRPGVAEWRLLAAYAAGGLLPALLVLWLWTPHLPEALSQFLWASRRQLEPPVGSSRLATLIGILGSGRFWLFGLIGAGLVLPLLGRSILGGERPGLAPGARAPWTVAATFAMAGLLTLLRSQMHPYYLTYFATWPVLGLGLLVSGLTAERRPLRRAAGAAGLALMVALVPSLHTNVTRAREAIRDRAALDQSVFAARLAAMIPRGVPVTGSPEMALIARRAGLDFTPVSWFAESEVVRPEAWVILIDPHRSQRPMVDPRSLAGRALVFEGPAFPGAKDREYPFAIFGPTTPPGQDHRE